MQFDFLWQRAGFQIAEAPISAAATDPVWFVLLAGLLNTLLASALAGSLAVVIGIALGLGREASFRPIARCAAGLIEAVRNTPVLPQLFLWYAVLTQALPGPRQALEILPGILLCNRGLFLPWVSAGEIDWPRLGGFNISGGITVSPELTALAVGLGLLHGCYLAEIFRAGFRAVPVGQRDAARALALGTTTTFRKVVLPQALGFALPSVAVQILGLVKNTSLAVAIGFPDFVGTLATVVNRNGRAFEGLLLTAAVFLPLNAALGKLIESVSRRPGGALAVEVRSSAGRSLSWVEIAISMALLLAAASPLCTAVRWLLIDATWSGNASACAAASGACWAVVTDKARLLLFGLYPMGETWRPAAAVLLVIGLMLCAIVTRRRSAQTAIGLAAGLLASFWLLGGGAGLQSVSSTLWGGLALTVLLAIAVAATASVAALPLALARMARARWMAWPARGIIEIFRGIPLVALLLSADLLLPLLLPAGIEMPKLARAFVAIALLATVNLAEVLRGALRSVPTGQAEGAKALGLSGPASFALVVLPQALRIGLPAAVNVYVGAIKDTSLVLTVGILDVTGAARAAVADPLWMRYAPELYLFLAAAYFALCYPITRLARRLERQSTAASPSRNRSISAMSL